MAQEQTIAERVEEIRARKTVGMTKEDLCNLYEVFDQVLETLGRIDRTLEATQRKLTVAVETTPDAKEATPNEEKRAPRRDYDATNDPDIEHNPDDPNVDAYMCHNCGTPWKKPLSRCKVCHAKLEWEG